MNPYETCPTYRAGNLTLRKVRLEDADDLLACYSDRKAVSRMNADNCTSDFYYTTVEEMQNCIGDWLREYDLGAYVRFSVVAEEVRAVGTVELFVTDIGQKQRVGVLRVDLASSYETEDVLTAIAELSLNEMAADFGACSIITKAGHVSSRAAAFAKCGFTPVRSPKGGYYWREAVR